MHRIETETNLSTVIILAMGPANERQHYKVTCSLTGWTHTQKDLCVTLSSLWCIKQQLASGLVNSGSVCMGIIDDCLDMRLCHICVEMRLNYDFTNYSFKLSVISHCVKHQSCVLVWQKMGRTDRLSLFVYAELRKKKQCRSMKTVILNALNVWCYIKHNTYHALYCMHHRQFKKNNLFVLKLCFFNCAVVDNINAYGSQFFFKTAVWPFKRDHPKWWSYMRWSLIWSKTIVWNSPEKWPHFFPFVVDMYI